LIVFSFEMNQWKISIFTSGSPSSGAPPGET